MSRKCSLTVFDRLLAIDQQSAIIPNFSSWIRKKKRNGANPYGPSRLEEAGTNIVHRMSGGI